MKMPKMGKYNYIGVYRKTWTKAIFWHKSSQYRNLNFFVRK